MPKKKSKVKALVIDDSVEIQFTLKTFLEELGCDVTTADNGEDGLALARINDFTVILIDIWMPGLDGRQVLKKMKKIFPEKPIIMITGVDDEDTAQNCMDIGAYDFIRKPFDFEYLETSVLSTIIAT